MNQYRTLYKALPFCIEDKESQDILEKDNLFKTYTYISNFANVAYCEDNEEFFKAKQKQAINLLYEENCRSLYLGTMDKVETHFNSMSSSLYVDIQERAIYIFANNGDYVDCEEIYGRIIEELCLQESLENLKNYQVYTFLDSLLLLGGHQTKQPYTQGFFGELDSHANMGLNTLKPIYYFAPKEENSTLGKLSVFYHNHSLILLNYSLLDSSLNIKLEGTSKESQAILQTQQETKKQEIKPHTLSSKPSLAHLHALLENQEVQCVHGGKVILESIRGAPFKSDGIPIILESDLLYSKIIGCPNSVASIPTPCTKVIHVKAALSQKKVNGEYAILQELITGSLTDKGFPLMVSFAPSKFKFAHSYNPLEGLTKKTNTLQRFTTPSLRLHYKSDAYQRDNLYIYNLSINGVLKQEKNPLKNFFLSLQDLPDLQDISHQEIILENPNSNYEDSNPYTNHHNQEHPNKEASHQSLYTQYLKNKSLNHQNLLLKLQKDFNQDCHLKQALLRLDTNLIQLLFITPKKIPLLYRESYQSLENKDYGIGEFKELLEYQRLESFKKGELVNPFEGNKDLKNKDSKQQRDSNNQGFYEVDLVDSLPLYTLHTRVFLTPAKAKTIFLELAQGIDKDLEERDKRNTQTQSVCSFVIVNGGDKRILQKVKEEEGNIKEGEEESIKDKETQSISKKERKQVLEEEESQTEIPPNVIRIETEDNSGEYIEIILPEETQSNNSIPKDDSLFNQAEQFALDVGLSILLRGKYKPKPKTPKKTTQTIKKSKYATKQEVINTLRNKYGLKTSKEWHDMGYKQFDANKTVYLAKDNKQIKQIWEDIIEGAEELKDAINTKTGEKIPMRKLSDGTILKLRRVSDSGGSAIDIGRKNDRKIHNRAKEDGDW